MPKTETIRAVVEKIVYRKNDDGWSILRTDRGTVKGCVAWEPKVGDALQLEGTWKLSTFNGTDEFVFRTAMVDVPECRRALLTYAVSITEGMGEATAEKIWARYGENWPEAQDLDIKGLTAKARDCWRETLRRVAEQRDQAQAVAYLLDHGCTLNMAVAAWGRWGKTTISVTQADPFALAGLPRYGFIAVDNGIRQAFGIGDDDPRRAAAAVCYLLDENAKSGNTLAGRLWLEQRVAAICPVAAAKRDSILSRLVADGRVTLAGQWIARSQDWQNETAIWKRFSRDGRP